MNVGAHGPAAESAGACACHRRELRRADHLQHGLDEEARREPRRRRHLQRRGVLDEDWRLRREGLRGGVGRRVERLKQGPTPSLRGGLSLPGERRARRHRVHGAGDEGQGKADHPHIAQTLRVAAGVVER
eukprot:CAMPEP_0176293724 /NCGR_PEP_ID=MMETSP0121_2-20121125/56760_1 /TAXON_ID=160619 /ORGANISM="Kryptoperidinium foliaceum, Strain CCMP 1326" /LENGTH=129 /DNA_ID=CAMNT_0017634703 /DNA_START=107 /DNA_END=496 /DNA_ORIENTATION=-